MYILFFISNGFQIQLHFRKKISKAFCEKMTYISKILKYGYIHIYINFQSLESLSPDFLLLMINIKLHHTPTKITLKVHCTNRFIAYYVLKVLLTATSYFI